MNNDDIIAAIKDGRVLASLEAKLHLFGDDPGYTEIEQRDSDNVFSLSHHVGKHREIVDVIILSRPGRPIWDYDAPDYGWGV